MTDEQYQEIIARLDLLLELASKAKAKRFVPPTVEEVQQYCLGRRNGIEARQFVDFYTSKGWKVGNQAMKDWKSAVRTWEQRGAGKVANQASLMENLTDRSWAD